MPAATPFMHVDMFAVKRAVGEGAYTRGMRYAANGAVIGAALDAEQRELTGRIRGSGRQAYRTVVGLKPSSEPGIWTYVTGNCSCPVGYNCKHCVALAAYSHLQAQQHAKDARAAAAASAPAASRTAASRPAAAARAKSTTPSWRNSLRPLTSSPAAETLQSSMGVELILVPAPSPRGVAQLTARVVTPGKTKWIASKANWSTLGYTLRDSYPEPQLQALRALYALGYSASAYRYSTVQTIDLAEYPTAVLWAALAELVRTGVVFVGSDRITPLPAPGLDEAEARVNIVADSRGRLSVDAALHAADGRVGAAQVAYLGPQASPHGVAWIEAGQLRLAPLRTALPPALANLTTMSEPLRIPAKDREIFVREFLPALRKFATIESADDSFAVPSATEPNLFVRSTFHDDHRVTLDWLWSYRLGDEDVAFPLEAESGSDGAWRDHDREQEILSGLDLPFAEFGLSAPGSEFPMAPHAELTGTDTLRFVTEFAELLDADENITVDTVGTAPDYRDVGDLLRIEVSADETPDRDWFDLGVQVKVAEQSVPITDLLVALATEETHLLLPDGSYLTLDRPELHSLRALLEEARELQDRERGGPPKISRYQVGLWEELAALGVVTRQSDRWKQQVTGLRSASGVAAISTPDNLDAELRPYQLDGFRWLAFLWEYGLGGILADDMGLGKTVQTLALIAHAINQADNDERRPFLIVAPTSVVPNWASEVAKFTGALNAAMITDTEKRRGVPLDAFISQVDIVITSYTLFRLEYDSYAEIEWAGLILDEAQFVKNHQSQSYRCARALDAPFKLAITGTPMENNLMELWSLLSITAPGLFPSPEKFATAYRKPIEIDRDTERLQRMQRRIRPLLLRRTKEDVATDLPPKLEQVLELTLHPRHRKVYDTHLRREQQKILKLIDDGMDKNRFAVLQSITLLRQLSLSAALIDDKHKAVPSVKIDALIEQLTDVVGGGHGALVFSQFTGFLSLVRARLDDESIPYSYLDGSTRNRAAVLKEFKSGATKVFLISLKSGGFGLNLTEADYCFLLDPWWNPATEAQAVDRAHRIGQERKVLVYRMIAKDTIEEKVAALKERKQQLISGVFGDEAQFAGALTANDIRTLFE